MEQVDYPIGDFKNPFDLAMADRKFLNLAADALGDERAEKLLEDIHHLESTEDINTLFQ